VTPHDDAGERVRRVADESELADALAVRRAVFVDEQGVPPALETDGFDELGGATHFVAYDGDRAVGAARLRRYDGPTAAGVTDDGDVENAGNAEDAGVGRGERAKVERVAVRAARRGEGWGTRLMDAVEAAARDQGFDRLVLHAQTAVAGLYAARGYERVGEEFEEAGIAHVEMVREL
jgi:predicted GNAT family N-acyltransferase